MDKMADLPPLIQEIKARYEQGTIECADCNAYDDTGMLLDYVENLIDKIRRYQNCVISLCNASCRRELDSCWCNKKCPEDVLNAAINGPMPPEVSNG